MAGNNISGPLNSGRPAQSQIVIYGAGGLAREIVQLIRDLAKAGKAVECIGFLVDASFLKSEVVAELPVLGDFGWLRGNDAVTVVIGIGSPAVRGRIAARIEEQRFASVIHPRATVGHQVIVGGGSIVCAGAVATTDIRIGAHVQLHVNTAVGHDCTIEDYVTVAPGANVGGATHLGRGAFIGAGAVVLPHRRVGNWSIVTAGAVVTADVPDNSTVAGVPAKIVAQRPPDWHLDTTGAPIERP